VTKPYSETLEQKTVERRIEKEGISRRLLRCIGDPAANQRDARLSKFPHERP